ncbi:hypothetical protein EJ772_07630 [Campylobacter upsaliensis]|uniref:hypothetical protein n=1 Tax=Campylobacter upsaliensis TaxID=28080 RepID=UPI00185B30D9|nr:hypothetical protein [Campylobacter upsaliensis]EAH6867755.1 hypothetical protein [Campylobacter upsaliensis]EKC1470490.1 hypothetical protein [Campylobacter upsaliensis]
MTTGEIKELFEKKLEEKTQNQKVVFTKNESERPHNGSGKEVSDFLSSLQNDKIMKKETNEASDSVVSLVREYNSHHLSFKNYF